MDTTRFLKFLYFCISISCQRNKRSPRISIPRSRLPRPPKPTPPIPNVKKPGASFRPRSARQKPTKPLAQYGVKAKKFGAAVVKYTMTTALISGTMEGFRELMQLFRDNGRGQELVKSFYTTNRSEDGIRKVMELWDYSENETAYFQI